MLVFQKLEITMGTITAVNPAYLSNEKCMDVEFNIQQCSDVKFLGALEGADVINPRITPKSAWKISYALGITLCR